MKKYTDKTNNYKTSSWTTMQARLTDAECEQETGVLLLLGRERRGCRPRRDGTIEHDSTDARIDRCRELSGLHTFQERDSLVTVPVPKFRSNHSFPG